MRDVVGSACSGHEAMHIHAEHTLFFEHRQPLWRPMSRFALALGVLIANLGARSHAVSLVGAGSGFLLLIIAYVPGRRRIEPAVAWILLLITGALLAGAALRFEMAAFVNTASRVACGVIWVFWLGTQLDWAALRQIMLALRVPEHVVASLDHALLHGALTRGEWARRRDAARLRLGASRLPLSTWGQLFGEGALQAFLRLERVEENALLRSRPTADANSSQTVRLDAVVVERAGKVVLDELDLRVEPGEWVLLCGPSGAGKSSLLRLLAGLDGPTQGVMTRLGSSVSPGAKLDARLDGRVALLGQNPEHHFIASTVAEDIAWGLRHRGLEDADACARSTQMAKDLGIDHLMGRPCHALSFGEQRRVALAGLLVLEPALLLLDEPTAGLDPVTAQELRALVERSVRRTGAACVWATHDLHSRPTQARRVVLLRDGKMVFDGPTEDGLSRPWLLRAGLAVVQGDP